MEEFDLANTFGLCDMHGNVWEWCQDHWHKDYEGAPMYGSAWLTDDEEAGRIIRGGSWGSYPGFCRSAYRNDVTPVDRNSGVGFRVSCSAPRTQLRFTLLALLRSDLSSLTCLLFISSLYPA